VNDPRNDDPRAPEAAHPAARTLERLAFEPTAAIPAEAAMERARAHLVACPTCAAEIVSLRAASGRFLAARPTGDFVKAVERRAATDAGGGDASRATSPPRSTPRPRWWLAGGGIAALGAAALAAVVILGPRLESLGPARSNRIATKGGGVVNLRLFVSRHGEDAQPLDPSSALHPGEVLRFEAVVPADGYAAIFDLDDRGRIERYHPAAPGAESAPVARGRAVLPESIHLDDFIGEELIALVFSEGAPLDLDRAQRALTDAYRAAGGVLSRIGDVPLEGASLALVRVRKERPR